MRLGRKSFPISFDGSSKLFWAAVLLSAVAAAWPLLSGAGLLNTRGGGDSPFLLQRLHQLVTAVLDGHLPVRWMPDVNYGYGYPFYNYYAPLSIYIAAVFRFLGFSYVGAIKAAQLSGFMAAGGGMFYLGRRWFKNSWAGLLAAAAYTFAPFHMVNIYVRGDSLAEFWAMAFYPLVIIAAGNLVEQPKRPGHIALFALTYAALILSHNISALIFTPFLLLYLAFTFLRRSNTRFTRSRYNQPNNYQLPITNYQSLLLALFLALALSAWFWLPALAEQGLAQLEPVTTGYFQYSNHFRGADLVQSTVLFDYDVAGGGAFRMGLVQVVAVVAGSAVLLLRGIRKRGATLWRVGLIIVAALIATFMITPLSRPLWDNLPLLPFTQFPWRFLSVQAFFGALAAGGLALLPGRKVVVPVVILAIAVSGLGDLQTDHLYLTDGDVTAERLAEYEWFTGNIGSTVSAEYLPGYVQPRPFTSSWLNSGSRAAVLESNEMIEAEPILLAADGQSWLITTDEPTVLVSFPVLDWPGWEADVDGLVVDASPAPGSGWMTLSVPSGAHTVDLKLRRTPVRFAAEIVSIIAVIFIALLFWPTVRSNINRQWLIWGAAGITGLVLLGIGLRLWPEQTLSPDTLSWDFEQLGYLHHSPDGIPFEGDLLLRRYIYSRDSAVPGEEINITLTWENGNGGTAEIALLTPAIQRKEITPIPAAQTQNVEPGEVIYRLTIPENAPAGLYVPRLTVNGAKALTDSGQTRGDLFLRPIRIRDNSQPADPDGASLEVRAIDVAYQSSNVLLVQLQWLTRKPLTENYNVSLRLVDSSGLVLAQQDAQPGFGYLPSSGWLPGRWEDDWLTLPLPGDLSAEQLEVVPYALVARLYDVETEEAVLVRRLGEMVWEGNRLVYRDVVPVPELPDGIVPAVATFEEIIRLEGYTVEKTAESLDLTLIWHTLKEGQEDFFHFVHLVDPETGEIIAQHDSMPRNNTYPTSQWSQNEIVVDPVQLSLENVPHGEYLLYVGLYRNLGETYPPLAVAGGAGRPLDGNQLLLEKVVIGN